MDRTIHEMTWAVVGMGLIGGSYAKRLTELGARVIGINRTADPLAAALLDGAVAETGEEHLSEADGVIFAVPEAVTEAFVRAHTGDFKPGAVLTDAAGVKSGGAARIQALLPAGMDFISGHPMAGREGSGYDMADAGIFDGANYLLIPLPENRRNHVERIRALALALGCGHVEEVTAEAHDRIIAYTSDLLHALAASIMNSPSFTETTKYFTAGAFRDMTRIADINGPLWTALFLENRENVLREISCFRSALDRFSETLEQKDEAGLLNFLREAGERKRGMTYGNHSRQSGK